MSITHATQVTQTQSLDPNVEIDYDQWNAEHVITGVFGVDNIPDLPASKITSERLGLARLPSGAANYVIKGAGVGSDPVYGQVDHDELIGVTPSQHHTKYTNEEVITAVEAEPTLDLTGLATIGADGERANLNALVLGATNKEGGNIIVYKDTSGNKALDFDTDGIITFGNTTRFKLVGYTHDNFAEIVITDLHITDPFPLDIDWVSLKLDATDSGGNMYEFRNSGNQLELYEDGVQIIVFQAGTFAVNASLIPTANRDLGTELNSWNTAFIDKLGQDLDVNSKNLNNVGNVTAVAGKTIDFPNYKVGGVSGVDGSFTTVDDKTVTVTKGLITSIV